MDTINKNWIAANRFAGCSDYPSQKLLARLQSDPANQVIINQDSENEEDGSIEAGSRATQHNEDNVHLTEEQHDSTHIATDGTCIKHGALPPIEISVQCMQFITALENQQDHISPRRADFSACLKIFIGQIQQWQPIPAASMISREVAYLLRTAYRYFTAVQELKQLEADHAAWWFKKRPGGRTASQIREALILEDQLREREGQCLVASPYNTANRGTPRRAVTTGPTGFELQPVLESVGRMLQIWARDDEEHGLKSTVVRDFETKCNRILGGQGLEEQTLFPYT
jgi:hypothetical protein